jgi:hypothetical protein
MTHLPVSRDRSACSCLFTGGSERMTICPPDNQSRQSSAGRTDLRPRQHNTTAHPAHSPDSLRLIGGLHRASRSLHCRNHWESTLLPCPLAQRCGLRAGGCISLLVRIERRDFQKHSGTASALSCGGHSLRSVNHYSGRR